MKHALRLLTALILIALFPQTEHAGNPQARIEAEHAMVVSAHELATEAGLAILRNGGNAADAAVAVGFALAVVYPEAGNIGGGGFLLYRNADGKASSIDFREKAPRSASRDMYVDAGGKLTSDRIQGHRSAGVPGSVAGLLKTLEELGTMKRAAVIRPAIRLAEEGFVVDQTLSDNLEEYRDSLLRFEATKAIFFPRGEALRSGDTLRQPDLAKTLRRIASSGARDFYQGVTAGLIVDEMRRGGGYITYEDLKAYKSVRRAPVSGTYRGYEILSVPPPSSGGVLLLSLLNLVEPSDLAAMGFHSEKAVHLMTEAMKRVYADRAEYLGDPDRQRLPIKALTSKKYAKSRLLEFDPVRASRASGIHPGRLPKDESDKTTHYVVRDARGNVASVTYTLNELFGSKVIVKGAGFFLNDQMDDFSSKPGVPNIYGLIGGEANAIAPEKRPLSSMMPTIVLKNGTPVLVLGARGGSKIITAVFQAIVNFIDFGLPVDEAVRAPRFHHQWLPDTLQYEPGCFPASVVQGLTARGHVTKETQFSLGELEALSYDPKRRVIVGGPDPREGGVARGY